MPSIIKGDKAVIRNLQTLAVRTQKKILRKVVRKAQKPMIADARRRVQKRSGQLRKSLGTVIRTYGMNVLAVGGPRGGFRAEFEGKPVDPIFYSHLVESGHVLKTLAVRDPAGGTLFITRLRAPGRVRAFQFLKPAFDAVAPTAKAQAMEEIAREIEKEAERQANKR